MKYVLGVDSGGTKYLVRACGLEGQPLGEYTGAPAGHYRFPREEALRRINENISRCLEQFGGKREDCACLVCGTTGVDTDEDQKIVEEIYHEIDGFSCPILCANDASVAHYAVTGGVGVVVIAGTGSIAYGRNGQGEVSRSGGWPPVIFGDEGSGTWISYRALHHLSLLLDNRVEPSVLSRMTQEATGISDGKKLIETCINIEQGRWRNPGLAAVVDAAAGQGDAYAVEILQQAAQHTFTLTDSVICKLSMGGLPALRVGAWGSAIVKSPLHFRFFKELVERAYPNAEVLISQADAAQGACMMALDHLHIVRKEDAAL